MSTNPGNTNPLPDVGGAADTFTEEEIQATIERQSEAEAAYSEDDEDFISTYAAWADVVELPRVMHEAVAIQLVAALLNMNRVFICNGPIWYPMDIWLVLLSESGGGRSSLLDFAKQVVDDTRIFEGTDHLKNIRVSPNPGLINDCRWGSPQTLFQELSRYMDKNLYVWGELSEKFALLNSGPFKSYGAKAWITDLYDKRSRPDSITYRKTGKSSDTQPIEFLFAPRINILAGSSVDWFYTNLYGDDSLGGWLPRWMFIKTGPLGEPVPRPPKPDLFTKQILVEQLRAISQLTGEATMPEEIWQDYEEWYKDNRQRFLSYENPALATPYWNRHKGHILKLAVIYEAAMNGRTYKLDEDGYRRGLCVGWDAWLEAKAKADELSDNIFEMLGTGMTAVGYAFKRYEDHIRSFGEAGVLRSDFTYAFKNDTNLQKDLTTLLSTERVHSFYRKSIGGRPGEMLVHRDWCKGRCNKCRNVTADRDDVPEAPPDAV